MTPQELSDLKARAQYALHHKFHVGLAMHYIAEMGGTDAPLPHGVKRNSPEHLLHIIEMYEANEPKASTKSAASSAEVKGSASVKATASKASKKKETEPPPPPAPPPAVAPAPVAPAVEPPKETWEVVLTSAGDSPVALVRELREILGGDLREIETLISFLPDTVKTGLSQADAETMKARLEKAGAVVEARVSH